MTITVTYSKGDLVIVEFPFSTGIGSKPRPALVVFDTGDRDVILARMTSRPPATPFDLSVLDWQGAGLRGPSVVRLHKLNTPQRRWFAIELAP